MSRSPKQLPPDLKATRRKLGLSLITFEDANIELDPFMRTHPFETFNFLTGAVIQHYRVRKLLHFFEQCWFSPSNALFQFSVEAML